MTRTTTIAALLALSGVALFPTFAASPTPPTFYLQARQVASKKSTLSSTEDVYGSYAKTVSQDIVVDIEVKNPMTNPVSVLVETFFVARPASGNQADRWIADQDRETVQVEGGRSAKTTKSPRGLQVSESKLYTAVKRTVRGDRFDGWIVRGKWSGQLVRVLASSKQLEEIGWNDAKLTKLPGYVDAAPSVAEKPLLPASDKPAAAAGETRHSVSVPAGPRVERKTSDTDPVTGTQVSWCLAAVNGGAFLQKSQGAAGGELPQTVGLFLPAPPVPMPPFANMLEKFLDWSDVAKENKVESVDKVIGEFGAGPARIEFRFVCDNAGIALVTPNGERLDQRDVKKFQTLLRFYPDMRREFDEQRPRQGPPDALFR